MSATTPPKKPAEPKREDVFTFDTEAGDTIVLPPFKKAKPGVLRKARKLDQVDQFFTILESLATDEALALIDDLESDEFQDLQRAWFENSGIDLGEAKAS